MCVNVFVHSRADVAADSSARVCLVVVVCVCSSESVKSEISHAVHVFVE